MLKRINMNYLLNSRKLLTQYPKQNLQTLVNKKKDDVESGAMMSTYITPNENVGDMINKIVFNRILNIKSKHRKADSSPVEPQSQAQTPINIEQELEKVSIHKKKTSKLSQNNAIRNFK